MKKVFGVLLMLLAGAFVVSVCAQAVPPETGYKCRRAEFYEDGTLKKCRLLEPVVIEGYPCKRWVRWHSNGRLKQLELSRDHTVQGIRIPATSNVFLHDDGVLESCWIWKDVTIQGVPCDGGWGKMAVSFYRDGKLKYCFLSEHTEIQGIPCRASVFHIVGFHPNGKLKRCTLSRDHVIAGREYRKGSKLYFDAEGNVQPPPAGE